MRLFLVLLLLCLASLSHGALLNPALEGDDSVASLGGSHAHLMSLGKAEHPVGAQERENPMEDASAEAPDVALLEQMERASAHVSSPYTHELREKLALQSHAEAEADAEMDAAELSFDGPLIARMEGPESAAEIMRHLEPLLNPANKLRPLRREDNSMPSMPLLTRVEQRRLRTQHMKNVLQTKYARQQARRAHLAGASDDDGFLRAFASADADADAKAGSAASSGASKVSSVSDHPVVKSSEDDRLYRFITLQNGLRAVLVSDPNTTKSAAALDVGNGYLSDPPNIPGMAHFLEHMLFLGTEKYPSESAYADFIEAHGGFSNAYTAMENTNYYFDILPNHLEGALDRFAQFFIKPLLNVNSTGREMKAVDSEHSKNLLSDNWRTNRLMQAIANQSHPYAKFGTGCAQTLDVMPHSEMQGHLRAFWQKHYTANNLFLSVIGQESLDQLQKMVDEKFSAVPKGEGAPYSPLAGTSPRDVFNSTILGSQVFVNTIEDTKFLSLVFPLDSQYPTYRYQAVGYLRTLVEGRGANSLLKQLKSRGWATTAQMGVDAGTSAFATVSFSVDLTLEGANHVDEIIAAFFATLATIRKGGLEKWRFDEMQRISNLTFTYKDKEQPSSYISKLAANLRRYPPEDVLIAGKIFLNYSRPQLERVLDALNPDNMIMLVGGKNLNHKMRFKEKWYGIDYDVMKLDGRRIKQWKNAARVASKNGWKFALPAPSKFIPKSLRVNPPLLNPVPYPIILRESARNATAASRLWFSEDLEFHRPQAHAVFRMYVPHLYASPRSYLLTNIYVNLLEDQMDEELYAALLAGFSANFRVGTVYVDLVFQGFNAGLLTYAQAIAAIMNPQKGFKPDARRFEVYKETLVNTYLNKKYEAPHRQSTALLNSLLDPRMISNYDLVRTLQSLTFAELVSWPATLFADMSLEAYVHGNVAPELATQLLELFQANCPFRSTTTHFHRNPARNHYVPRARLGQVKEDVAVQMYAPNPAETNSAVVKYWQYGMGGLEGKLYSQLLALMSQKPIFHQLRTTEQLGYIVWSSADSRLDVNGFKIQVQSGRRPAHYVSQRIDAFVQVLQGRLKNMTQAAFEGYIETLMMSKLQSPVSMGVQTAWFWSEISRQEFVFQRKEIELYILNATKIINRAGFEQFVNKLFYISDPANPGVEACEVRGGGVVSVRIEAPKKQPAPPVNGVAPKAAPAAVAAKKAAKKPVSAKRKSHVAQSAAKKNTAEAASAKAKLLAILDAEEQLDRVAELQERVQAQRDRKEEQQDKAEEERDRMLANQKSLLQTEAEAEAETEVEADAAADLESELDAELAEQLSLEGELDLEAEESSLDDLSFLELHTQIEAEQDAEMEAEFGADEFALESTLHKPKVSRAKAGGLFHSGSGKALSLRALDNPITIVTRARGGGLFVLNTTQANVHVFTDSLALYPRNKYSAPPHITAWRNVKPVKTAALFAKEKAQAAAAITQATGIAAPVKKLQTAANAKARAAAVAKPKQKLAVKNGKPIRAQKLAAAKQKIKAIKKKYAKKQKKAAVAKKKKQAAAAKKKKAAQKNKAEAEAEAEAELDDY